MNIYLAIGILSIVAALILCLSHSQAGLGSVPQPITFIVNHRPFTARLNTTQLTYQDIVSYTGRPAAGVYTVSWYDTITGMHGDLTSGQSIRLVPGLVFTAVVTGAA